MRGFGSGESRGVAREVVLEHEMTSRKCTGCGIKTNSPTCPQCKVVVQCPVCKGCGRVTKRKTTKYETSD